MIRPSRARFLMAERPEPLVWCLPAPVPDPYELYRRGRVPGRPSFLLESGKGSDSVARYSFFGCDPYLVFSGKGSRYELQSRDGVTVKEGSPWRALTALLRASRIPKPDGVPPFFGGAVGFIGYDAVRAFARLPDPIGSDSDVPDFEFAFVDLVAALDHHTNLLHLVFAPPLERLLQEPREKLYREGCDRLSALEARLSTPAGAPGDDSLDGNLVIAPEQHRSDYMQLVRRCREYIAAGDIYQANLSHRFTIDLDSPHAGTAAASTESSGPSARAEGAAGKARRRPEGRGLTNDTGRMLYGRLRNLNPAPFSALLEFDDVTLVSSSPERLVRLRGRHADTRPIAGTRPRGRSVDEDRRLVEELLSNSKERAEHLMLVDLERNDLGRVCNYGSVSADEFMVVERYSHVSHIVSNVTGTLHDRFDGFDLIRAVFPGGTITGVPKIRCMEILQELEPVRRGAYSGSLGYVSWSGDLDLNIIIRTIVLSGGRGYLQVGAGIVADSDPAREYDETLFKAQALIEALKG